MAVTFDMEVDVKSPADAYWNTIKDINFLYPKLFPEIYESIDILEGDGRSVNTIRLVTHAKGYTMGRSYKSKIVSLDEENKSVTYTVLEGDPLKIYKSLDDTITVRAKDNGSVVHFSCTFEIANNTYTNKPPTNEPPKRDDMQESLVGVFKKLDAYTLANMNKK